MSNTVEGDNFESFTMSELTLPQVLLASCVVLFTAAAAAWDFRTRRIPNWLTVAFFLLGILFQAVFGGWTGLGDAALGFLVGFGTLFLLWMIGSAGGGDVKLMGALSLWLGFRLTLYVMVASTVFVLVGTLAAMAWSLFARGPWSTKQKFIATEKPLPAGQQRKGETVLEKQNRRIMAFAVPLALATWAVLFWKLPVM